MSIPFQTPLALIIFAIPGSFHIGFQGSVYNQPQKVMEAFVADSYVSQFHEPASQEYVTTIWALVISGYSVGGLISDFFCQYLMDTFGRKGALNIAAVLNLSGSSLQALAYILNLYQLLIVGRFITGIATTIGICTQVIFFSEIAPTKIRGTAGATGHVVSVFGTIIANLLGFPGLLGSRDNWVYLPTISIVVLLIFLAVSWKFPESPKHLVSNKNQPELARLSMAFYNGPDADVEMLLETIYAESKEDDFGTSKWRIVNLLTFLKSDTNYWRLALFQLVYALSLPFCGLFIMMNFSVYILTSAGVEESIAHYGALSYTLVDSIMGSLNLYLIEQCGRTKGTIFGAWTTDICLTVIFICQALEEYHMTSPTLPILALMAVLAHATGKAVLAGVRDTYSGELFPSFIRATAFIYCGNIWGDLANIFLSLSFLPIGRKIGSWALLILLIIPMTVIACVLTKFCPPETKGKHVSSIIEENRDPIDKSDLREEKNSN